MRAPLPNLRTGRPDRPNHGRGEADHAGDEGPPDESHAVIVDPEDADSCQNADAPGDREEAEQHPQEGAHELMRQALVAHAGERLADGLVVVGLEASVSAVAPEAVEVGKLRDVHGDSRTTSSTFSGCTRVKSPKRSCTSGGMSPSVA